MDARLRKEHALLAFEELERRRKRLKPAFVPNSGQREVMLCKKPIILVTSGNGAGKTALACVKAINRCMGRDPIQEIFLSVPTKVIYVLDRPSKVADKIIPELNKFFDTTDWQWMKDGSPTVRRIVLPNGSELIFMFHEADALAWESIDGYSLIVMDEPPPRHAFIGLQRGARTKGARAQFIIIGTPIGPNSSWMRTELFEAWKNGDEDIAVFNFATEVNRENLDEGYIENFSKRLSEKEKEIRLRGQWSDLDGLALAHLFKESVHVRRLDWEESYPCAIAIDPHPSKAHVAILLGALKDGRLHVLKELKAKLVPREFARTLKTWMKGHRVIDIVVDNLGSAEMTGGEGFKSFIDVLNEEGIRCRPTSYHEKVDGEWIERMQDALLIPEEPNNFGVCEPVLTIDPDCRLVISDIKNVQWMKLRNLDEYKPTLDISNKDGLSCLKYALATRLSFDKPKKMRPHYASKPLLRGITTPKLRSASRLRRSL